MPSETIDIEDVLERVRMKEAEHPDENMLQLIIRVADELLVDETEIVDALIAKLREITHEQDANAG